MQNLFNTPVMIKPLGIIVPPSAIRCLAITTKMSRNYKVIRPDMMDENLMVSAEVLAEVSATFVIDKDVLSLRQGATEFNERAVAAIKAEFEREKVRATAPAQEPKRRGRRGRPAAVVEETVEDEAPEVNYDEFVPMKAYSIPFLQYRYQEHMVPIQDSAPYRFVQNVGDKQRNMLEEKISQLIARKNKINELRSKLSVPTPESVQASLGSLIPQSTRSFDADVQNLDRQGLEAYEAQYRRNITANEDAMRGIYEWFEVNMMEYFTKHNATLGHVTPFKGDFKIGDEVVTTEKVISDLKEEVFLPVHF
jgi:hypothetical protein